MVSSDGRGKKLSSPALVLLIDDKCTGGHSEFSFLIGCRHVLDDNLVAKADAVVSFGEMISTHQRFRGMLCEQLYRARTINAGTPYHK